MKALFDYTKVNNILSALERMPLVSVDCRDSDSPAAPMRAALSVIGTHVLSEGHYGCVVRIDSGAVLKLAIGERDGYPAYIEWAARNPQPHVPRVFAHGWIGPMFWCVLPRYCELNGEDSYRIDCMSERAAFIKTRGAIKARFSNFRWDLHPANMMFDLELGEYVITDPLANVKGDKQSRDCAMYQTLGVEQLTTQAELDFGADPQPTSMPDFQHRVLRRNPLQDIGLQRNIGPDGGSGCEPGDDWGDPSFHIDWDEVVPSIVAVAWDGTSPSIRNGMPTCCVWHNNEPLPQPGLWRACRVRPGFVPRSET